MAQVFEELTSLPGMDTHISSNSESASEEGDKKFNPISQLMDFVSAVFTPFLGALAGAGILKGILALVITLNWLSSESGAYKVWNAASDAIFISYLYSWPLQRPKS